MTTSFVWSEMLINEHSCYGFCPSSHAATSTRKKVGQNFDFLIANIYRWGLCYSKTSASYLKAREDISSNAGVF